MLESNETKTNTKTKCGPIMKFFALIGMSTTFFSILSLCALGYIWFADPFGVRAFVQGSDFGSGFEAMELLHDGGIPSIGELQDISVENGELQVPEEYKKLLDVVGVDIDTLAEQDPVALEACASAQVGAERAAELEAGAQPGISDFLALKKCL